MNAKSFTVQVLMEVAPRRAVNLTWKAKGTTAGKTVLADTFHSSSFRKKLAECFLSSSLHGKLAE